LTCDYFFDAAREQASARSKTPALQPERLHLGFSLQRAANAMPALDLATAAEEAEEARLSTEGTPKKDSSAHFREFHARDPWWLLHKAVFTIYCASIVFYLPLIGVYARGLGMTSAQIGTIAAVPPLCELVFTSLWTWLSDHGAAHRRGVMVGCLLLSTVLRCLTGFVTSYRGLLVWTIITESIATPVMAVLDASTFAALDATVGTAHYGWLRAWGAVGWGLMAPAAGALVDRFGPSAMWIGLASLSGPSAVLMLYLPLETRAADRASMSTAWTKLLSPDVLLFLCVCFINGVLGAGVIGGLLFPYLVELGASTTLLGTALLFTCISEVPFFFISARLLDTWGHTRILALSLLAFAARLLYYSVLRDPWWTLPAELLHGATYALAWASATRYAYEEFPPELCSTAQGLLASVQWGLGGGLGAVLGGALYQAYGARILFRASSLLAGVGLALLLVRERLAAARRRAASAAAVDRQMGSG